MTSFLLRRIKRLGFGRVLGQVLFQLCVVPCIRMTSRERTRELQKKFKFDTTSIDPSIVHYVPSANSTESIELLKRVQPDLVLINGTRILSKDVLTSIPATFINMHAGITPLYRGVHGAYWALRNREREHCGVTVHIVDTGIDTGRILEQGTIDPEEVDTFVTYPLIQLGIGIPLLEQAISDVLQKKETMKENPAGKSRLWSHPTIWGYLRHRIVGGVK